jgi:hypothetical protein
MIIKVIVSLVTHFPRVVYYDYYPNTILTSVGDSSVTCKIGLNEVGIEDSIKFQIADSRSLGSFGSINIKILPQTSVFVAGYGGSDYPWMATNFSAGTAIGNSLSFTEHYDYALLYSDSFMGFTSYDFENSSSGFIGFAYIQGADTLYGWIRISTVTPGINMLGTTELTIKDIGLNTVSNGEIFAGEGISPFAEDIILQDISNNKDERDMHISFIKPINETGILEYRALIVPSSFAAEFNLTTAENIPNGNYLQIIPSGQNFSDTLPVGTTDILGNAITELVPYKVFVMTIGDGVNLTENFLSYPSNELVLTTSTNEVTNLAVSSEYTGGADYNISVDFDSPTDETGISDYQIMFVKTSVIDDFDTISANQVFAENYISVNPEFSHFSEIYSNSILKDVNGNTLMPDTSYNVCVLTAANMIEAQVPVLAKSTNSFFVSRPCSAIEYVWATDIGNQDNGSDMQINFTSLADESQILGYRIFVTNEEDAANFTNQAANTIIDGNYIEIGHQETSSSYILPLGAKSTDGNLISENIEYRVFVQSLANFTSTDINSLSPASPMIILSNPNFFTAGQTDGPFVKYFDFEPDSTISSDIMSGIYEKHFDLFINEDNEPDATITLNWTGAWHGENYFIDVETFGNTNICVNEANSNNSDILTKGYMLTSLNNWNNGTLSMAYNYGGWDGSGPGGLWFNAVNKYLGFRTITSQDTSFAWVRLSLSGAFSVSVKDYAVQNFSALLNTDLKNGLNIFPNPSNNYVNVLIPEESLPAEIKLFNINGKLIKSTEATSTYNILNIENLNAGMYIIKISGSKSVYINKLIIK